MSGSERPIVEVDGVSKAFVVGRRIGRPPDLLRALDGVTLAVPTGQVLGIVGESGSGKSTLARVIVGLLKPDAGRVLLAGRELTQLSGDELRESRKSIQMVFQDPSSSLNPRMRIGDALEEPLRVHGIVPGSEVAAERDSLLDRVGLSGRLTARLPRELSGGQRQRVSIARALAIRPKVLVADEAVSSLDVSVRAQILNLLLDLRDGLGLTLILISHDLSVIHHTSDFVAVMYFGRLVEYGPKADVLLSGAHPYTRALAAAIPSPTPSSAPAEPAIKGEPPSAIESITGCVFRMRCRFARAICATDEPPRVSVAPDHWAACHFAVDVASGTFPVASDTTRE